MTTTSAANFKMADMDNLKVGFIGGGNMALAIAKGFISTKTIKNGNIIVSARTEKTLEVWKNMGCKTSLNNQDIVKESDVVFVAVKPYIVPEVLKGISIPATKLIVSVAAGVSTQYFEEHLGVGSRVVRVMPNLPCAIQCGASCYCRGSYATLEDGKLVYKLLSTVGYVEEVKESMLDAVCGLSGSGVAYVYLAIEAMSDGGVKAGLPRKVATELATQTVLGAAKMVKESGRHTSQLKDDVCSPAGTTITGIQTLERAAFRSALIDAVDAAANKSREQGKQ